MFLFFLRLEPGVLRVARPPLPNVYLGVCAVCPGGPSEALAGRAPIRLSEMDVGGAFAGSAQKRPGEIQSNSNRRLKGVLIAESSKTMLGHNSWQKSGGNIGLPRRKHFLRSATAATTTWTSEGLLR